VKEDDVDHDKRRESAKKPKSAKDLEKKKEKKKNLARQKKKEKKKNLARQALETRRAKSRQRGSLRKNPPMRTMAAMVTMTATIPRGWCPVSIGSSRARFRPASTSRERESLRGLQAGLVRVNRGSHLRAALAPTPPSACARSDRPPPPTSSRI